MLWHARILLKQIAGARAQELSVRSFGYGQTMTTRVAINGLGRIGRAILKLVIDEPSLELVAVNDLVDVENLAYLLRFDTVYGRYAKSGRGRWRRSGGRRPQDADVEDPGPSDLPWKELGVELVFECTGALHAARGSGEARPGGSADRAPVGAIERWRGGNRRPWRERAWRGCRHHLLRELHDELHHADRRGHRPPHRHREGGDDDRARLYLVPVDRRWTQQACPARASRRPRTSSRPRVAPRLRRRGRCRSTRSLFDGVAIRAPIPIGSIADITFLASRKTSVDEVNRILAEEAETERYAGVLGVSRDPLVSSDIVGDPRASIVDLELTRSSTGIWSRS